jgi:hypothetical protein
MHPTLIRSTEVRSTTDAAHPSVRRPPGLGEDVEAGVGGDLDPSPSPLFASRPTSSARQVAARLSVADLQRALRIAQTSGDPALLAFPNTTVRTRWVLVLAAHSGAGASTIALAIGEASGAGSDDRDVRLVEYAAGPARSGLAAAAATELGVDATGYWRHGQRGELTLYRREGHDGSQQPAARAPQDLWPAEVTRPRSGRDQLVVVDLSGATWSAADATTDLTPADAAVVVLRVSVPGIRAAEVLIERLHNTLRPGTPVVAAMVGAKRWPGVVTAAFGPRLSELRDSNGVVSVPVQGRLAIAGLTGDPLPKPISAAGDAIVRRLVEPASHAAQTDRTAADIDAPGLFGFATETAR